MSTMSTASTSLVICELRQRWRVDHDDVSLALELVDDVGDPPRLQQVDRSCITGKEEA